VNVETSQLLEEIIASSPVPSPTPFYQNRRLQLQSDEDMGGGVVGPLSVRGRDDGATDVHQGVDQSLQVIGGPFKADDHPGALEILVGGLKEFDDRLPHVEIVIAFGADEQGASVAGVVGHQRTLPRVVRVRGGRLGEDGRGGGEDGGEEVVGGLVLVLEVVIRFGQRQRGGRVGGEGGERRLERG